MGNKLRNHTLVGLSYSICSQGDRLTGAFNYLLSSNRRPDTEEDA
jgi:hypothetical protein